MFPQMKPINWFFLLLFFFTVIFLYLINNYFIFNLKKEFKEEKINNYTKSLNWKW